MQDIIPTKVEATHQLIRNRRSIYPKMYNDKPIPKAIIWEMLENANWAPTHRMTEPWRFVVFDNKKALNTLAQYLADAYKKMMPADKFSELKYKKILKKPSQSACMIAICMKRDPKESVPVVEETNAVACAVQNILLTASAYDIGAYWSSPKTVYLPAMNDFLGLEKDDKCLGFLYMGYHDMPPFEGRRKPIQDKVRFF